MESLEIDPHKYNQLLFGLEQRQYNREKSLFNKVVLKKLYQLFFCIPMGEKENPDIDLRPITSIKPEWMTDFIAKHRMIRLLETNRRNEK